MSMQKRIVVCGSMAFHSEMLSLKEELDVYGHEVCIPELRCEAPAAYGGGKQVYFAEYIEQNGGIDAFPFDHEIWSLKEGAIRDHYEKIEWSDTVLVANYEKRGVAGYIGGNTLIEIGLAFYLKRPIYILNPVSSELSYKAEILGMRPTILDGTVEVFKI